MTAMDKCALCRSSEVSPLSLGDMYSANGVTCHHFCLLFSPHMPQNGKDDEGIQGFLMKDIRNELQRSNQVKCHYCSKPGASALCQSLSCSREFHLSCGVRHNALLSFIGRFSVHCEQHLPRQKTIPRDITEECSICTEPNSTDPTQTICTPCCGHCYHKACLQRMAQSSGYFFNCPTCRSKNDKYGFLRHVKRFGIYVPQRDASWECTPGAFDDLLSRSVTCDQRYCLSQHGRNYSESRGKPCYMLLCDTCGSFGSHVVCAGVKQKSRAIFQQQQQWHCPDCSAAFAERFTARGTSLKRLLEAGEVGVHPRTIHEALGEVSWRQLMCNVEDPRQILKFTVTNRKKLQISTRAVADPLWPGHVIASQPLPFDEASFAPVLCLARIDAVSGIGRADCRPASSTRLGRGTATAAPNHTSITRDRTNTLSSERRRRRRRWWNGGRHRVRRRAARPVAFKSRSAAVPSVQSGESCDGSSSNTADNQTGESSTTDSLADSASSHSPDTSVSGGIRGDGDVAMLNAVNSSRDDHASSEPDVSTCSVVSHQAESAADVSDERAERSEIASSGDLLSCPNVDPAHRESDCLSVQTVNIDSSTENVDSCAASSNDAAPNSPVKNTESPSEESGAADSNNIDRSAVEITRVLRERRQAFSDALSSLSTVESQRLERPVRARQRRLVVKRRFSAQATTTRLSKQRRNRLRVVSSPSSLSPPSNVLRRPSISQRCLLQCCFPPSSHIYRPVSPSKRSPAQQQPHRSHDKHNQHRLPVSSELFPLFRQCQRTFQQTLTSSVQHQQENTPPSRRSTPATLKPRPQCASHKRQLPLEHSDSRSYKRARLSAAPLRQQQQQQKQQQFSGRERLIQITLEQMWPGH